MNEITKNENAICEICGCVHEELFELKVNHIVRSICADCAEAEGFVRCVDCDEWVPEEETYGAVHGLICEDCYSADYFTCENCGDVHHISDMVMVNPNTSGEAGWCTDCVDHNAYQCHGCDGYFTPRYIDIVGDDDDCVCDDCNRWSEWHQCDNCGCIVSDDDAIWFERDEVWYCEDCDPDEDEDEGEALRDYHYKPYPEFKLRKGEDTASTLTFGVELEVDRGSKARVLCGQLKELEQPIYMKHDGSLGSEGVEIVTHPCSLAYHAYELRWAAISRTCISENYRSHDTSTCGLHIHVGRQQMGRDEYERKVTAGNLVLLVNALWDKLVPFTRRDPARLEQWANRNSLPDANDLKVMSDNQLTQCALLTVSGGRYQAVNLNNGETVEFRIFRGTLKRDTLIASIQLVSNLTKYAMNHTPTECLNATWSDVLSVQEHKELRAYVLERGLA